MRNLLGWGILFLGCLAFPLSCLAGQPPLRAVRTERPPAIDGVIGAEEWAGAARLENFVQFEPHKGQPARLKTVGYFTYDNTHIYIAVYAYDDRPDQILGRHSQRDGQIRLPQAPRDPVAFPDDAIIVFLDTFRDRRTCYFFATNPLGTQTDGTVQDDGRIYDVTWDTSWQVATRKVADGWTAEFAIPLRSLRFRGGKDRTWGFNLLRARRSTLETSVWNGPIENIFRVSQFGEIQGLDLEGGGARPYTFTPFALSQYQQGRTLRGQVGLDVRYAFRPETVAQLTINPDFATIEGDEEFVNLTRFEARLVEKRPFFLETNQKFQQRIQTFYSRRIADIDVGGRLISKYGPWDATLLVAESRLPSGAAGETGLERANYTIGRVERQYLRSSALGFMVANRSFDGRNEGSIGVDTAAFFTRRWGFTGQLTRSHGRYDKGNWAWFVRPSYDSSTGHFHFRYSQVGDRFGDNINSIGYIRDDDRRELDSDFSKTLWFKEGRIQRVILESKNNLYFSQQNMVVRGYHNIVSIKTDLRNRWSGSALFRNEYRLFEKGFHNPQAEFLLGYNTREYQSWAVGYQTGKSFDSDLKAVNAYYRRKLSPETAVEYQLSRVWLKPDPTQQATLINIFRVRHNFTRDLFIRIFFQTNSVIDRKNTEAVFVWRYKPPFGSVQFAYQRGRAALGERSQQGNTYFVKMAYEF